MGKPRFLIDQDGNEVSIKYINDSKYREHMATKKVAVKAIKLGKQIAKVKSEIFNLVLEFLSKEAKYNNLESWKGNCTIKTFDGSYMVKIRIQERIVFGHQLHLAKQKMDECVKNWGEGADERLKLIINKAFNVDKKDKVDTTMILSLKNIKIKDHLWQEAMNLLDEAITREFTKKYITVYECDEQGEYHQIKLNFSDIEV